ncbi:MAG: hypothetical protein ACREM2_10345, partial [Vulcanimicrobiaceae bacterium]
MSRFTRRIGFAFALLVGSNGFFVAVPLRAAARAQPAPVHAPAFALHLVPRPRSVRSLADCAPRSAASIAAA